jgi:hypothetical protein
MYAQVSSASQNKSVSNCRVRAKVEVFPDDRCELDLACFQVQGASHDTCDSTSGVQAKAIKL